MVLDFQSFFFLIKDIVISYLLSLGLLALEEASCRVTRPLTHPYEEAHMV